MTNQENIDCTDYKKEIHSMSQSYPMTPLDKEKLEKKLAYLKGEKQAEINDEIKQLRSFCHSSEDATFNEIFEQQSLLKKQISLIEDTLYHSVLIDSKDEKSLTVLLGSTVSFKEIPDGEEETYTIVGKMEANPIEHKISIESPIGKSLLGSQLNDELIIDIPIKQIKVKITTIR